MHGLPTGDTVSLNGWAGGLVLNLTRRIGIAANITGNYGSASAITGSFQIQSTAPGPRLVNLPNVLVGRAQVAISKHSLLVGPNFRLWSRGRRSMSIMTGIGFARYRPDSPLFFFVSANAEPRLPDKNGLAADADVSADLRLTHRISYRLIQSRFIAAHLVFGWQRSVQFATGLVVDVGK
jgi:hypothetical protein